MGFGFQRKNPFRKCIFISCKIAVNQQKFIPPVFCEPAFLLFLNTNRIYLKNQIYTSKCIELIEDKLQWGSSANWIDYNFKELSEQVFEVSKVSISIRTLKRIFKSAQSSEVYYEPQMATKNALAQYLNYRDWANFIAANFESPEARPHSPADNAPPAK
jgi:hypothetical protein